MTIHVKANIFIECKFKLPDGEGGATVVGSKKNNFTVVYSRALLLKLFKLFPKMFCVTYVSEVTATL